MKKIILFAIGILTSVAMLAVEHKDYEFGHFKYLYDDAKGTAMLTGVDVMYRDVEMVEIPSTIQGEDNVDYTVTEIGSNAFNGCSKLKRLILPETLKSIGQNAFNSCYDLKHIWCKVVDPSANGLSPNFLPGNNALDYSRMVTLYVPNISNYTNNQAWQDKFLDRIYEGEMSEPFPYEGNDYILAIGSKKATLYKGMNQGLIKVPSEISREGIDYVVTGIDRQAFYLQDGSSVVKNVIIEENVKAIGPEAFNSCKNLESIKLPSTLATIKKDAFKGCSNLVRVECHADASKIAIPSTLFGTSVNTNEKFLYVPNVNSYKTAEGWKAFTYFMQGNMVENVPINFDGVAMSFVLSTGSKEATLLSVETDKKELEIPYLVRYSYADYVVTVISKNAFSKAAQLEQLKFEDRASNSEGLKIGESALNGCSNLKILQLPKRLERIGQKAFNISNSKLAYIYFKALPNSDNIIGNEIFSAATRSKATLFVHTDVGYDNPDLGWDASKIIRCKDLELFYDDRSMRYLGWKNVGDEADNYAVLLEGVAGSSAETFTIINKVNGYYVTAIGESAFKGKGVFKKLIIEGGISKIEASAFQGLTSLESVSLPYGVRIGDNAFSGCTKLNKINLNYVTDIGTSAFLGCTNLESVVDFTNVKTIGKSAFQNCTSLERITLPSGLTTIGSNAFSGCSKLLEVVSKKQSPVTIENVFPDNDLILYIPSNGDPYSYTSKGWKIPNIYPGERKEVPVGDDGLKYVTVGDVAILLRSESKSISSAKIGLEGGYKIDAIARSAFEGCNQLNDVQIPNGLQKIGKAAFKGCSQLKVLQFPNSLKSIGDNAFENASLKIVEIPEGTTTIGKSAFSNCTKLEELTLPSTVGAIGDYAFNKCDAITTITCNNPVPPSISTNVFSSLKIEKIYVPGSLTAYQQAEGWKDLRGQFIAGEIFEGYDQASNSTLLYKCRIEGESKTATLIQIDAADAGSDGKKLTIPAEIEVQHGEDKFKFTVIGIGESVSQYNKDRATIETITINAAVKTIPARTFQNYSNLTNVTLSKSVTSIGDYAFNGTKLSKLNSATIKSIGTGAFSNSKITELRLDAVETIGENAFQNCGSLQNVWLPNTLSSASIGSKAFDGCNNIKNVNSKLASPSEIGEYVFSVSSTSNIATLFVPAEDYDNYNKGIWKNKFANIVKGDLIGEDTQDNLTYSLYSIAGSTENDATLAAILTKSSSNETEIKIKSSIDVLASSDSESKSYEVREIGAYSFRNSSKLNKVWLPITLTSIGDYAFAGCTDIKEIVSDIEEVFKLSPSVFSTDIKETAKVYIPDVSEALYKDETKSGDWSVFKFEVGKWLETEKPVDTYMKYRYHTSQKIATLIGVNPTGTLETLPIPKKVTIDDVEYTVTAIGPSVFKTNTDKGNIKTIDIQADIESIGANAFQGSSNLEKVILPSTETPTLSSIDKYVFQGCGNLSEISFPSSLTSVGDYAFSGTKLSELRSDNIKSIGVGAFSNSKIKELRLGVVETIGENAFQNCGSLQNVWLPNALTSIGTGAFTGCSSLSNVSIQRETLLDISNDVFSLSNPTATLFVPAGMTETYYTGGWSQFPNIIGGEFIGVYKGSEGDLKDMTFSYYRVKSVGEDNGGDDAVVNYIRSAILTKSSTSRKSVRVVDKIRAEEPELDGVTKEWYDYNVVSLGASSFSTSKNLENLTLSEGLNHIGKSAFESCSGISELVLPSTLESIGDKAFAGSTDIVKIVSDIKTAFKISEDVFADKVYKNAALFIPEDDAASYDADASGGWKKFEKKEQGKWEESDYRGIFKYRYHTSKKDATVIGIAFSGDVDTPLEIPSSFDLNGVRYYVNMIAPTTFDNRDKVKTLIIKSKDWDEDNGKSGIETISAGAFQNCSSLTSVQLPSSIKTIGDNVFRGCANLSKIELPASLAKIGENAFASCGKLTHVVSASTAVEAGAGAFSGIPNTATLFVPTKVGYVSESWESIPNVVEGEYVADAKDGDMTFACYQVKKDAEEDGYDRYAILTKAATGIKTASIHEIVSEDYKVVRIGKNAFLGCTQLAKVDLPQTLTYIGDNAFGDCSAIREIVSDIENKDSKFVIADDVFHIDVKSQATLYVPLENKTGYENADGWKGFDHDHIEVGKWMQTDVADDNYLKYRYHTGKKKAIVIEVVFPSEGKDELTIPSSFSLGEGEKAVTYDIESVAISTFSNNNKVKKLVIEDAPEGKYGILSIGANSFSGCSSLTTVFLPSSLREIGEKAFNGCAAIMNLNIQCATSLDVNANVFSLSEGNRATLFVGKGTSKSYNAKDGWNKFSNIIEGVYGGTYVGSLGNEKNLTFSYYRVKEDNSNHWKDEAVLIKSETTESSLTLPKKIEVGETTYQIKRIGSFAFGTNKSLINLTISQGIEYIGKSAFTGCTNLKMLGLPKKMKGIGDNAFGGCSEIREIISDIEKDNLFEIADNVFHSDAKTHATLYVPIESKTDSYEKTADWKNFKNIIEGKWFYTTEADQYYLKYRYHTGKKIATVVEVVFPADKKELIIPSTFTIGEGENAGVYDVDSIAISKFSEKVKVEKLIIQEATSDIENYKGIQTIDANSFQGCSNLSMIELPASLAKIGENAFAGCGKLTHVVSASSAVEAGAGAFSGIPNTATLFVPTKAGYVSVSWESIPNVVEGEYVADVTDGDMTFACYQVKKDGEEDGYDRYAILTKAATAIKTAAIHEKVKDEYTVVRIGKNAFQGCKQLSKLELPISLTAIGEKAFADCDALNYIVSDIEKVFPINENVFSSTAYNNQNLSFYVPVEGYNDYLKSENGGWSKLKPIKGKWMVSELEGLFKYEYHTGTHDAKVIEIVFPENPKEDEKTLRIKRKVKIGNSDIEYHVATVAPSNIINKDKIEGLIIEDNIEEIGASAFAGCTNLQKIWLPKSLDNIGRKAFNGCNLTRVNIDNSKLPNINKEVFTAYSAYLFVPQGTNVSGSWGDFIRIYEGHYVDESTPGNDKTYIYLKQAEDKRTAVLTGSNTAEPIPTDPINFDGHDYNITVVAASAFSGKNLEEWTSLPEGIVAIEKDAFKNTRLKEIKLPSTLKSIGKNAFANNKLTKIELPSSLTAIASDAFEGCSSLTEVISKIGDENGIHGISLSVPNAIVYVKEGTGDHYSNWTCLHVLEGDGAIGTADGLEYAYTSSEKSGNNAILIGVAEGGINENGAVVIPETVALGEANKEYKVIAIGKDAFKGNTNLKNLEISAHLASVGENAFEGCSNLAEVICNEYIEKLNVLAQFDALLFVSSDELKEDYVNAGWQSDRIFVGVRQEKELDGLVYAYTTADAASAVREAVLVGATAEAISKDGVLTIPASIKFKVNENDEDETEFNIKLIGEHAFDGCQKLKEVVSRITEPTVISSISFPQPGTILYVPKADLVDAYKAWNFTYTLVGERMGWNKDGLYYACATEDKKAILIESKAAEMRSDELSIPGSVKFKVDEKDESDTEFDVIAIANEAFKGNTDIKTLKIADGIGNIGASAFQGCLGLNKVWLPASLTNIKTMAFYGCSNISYVCTESATPLATVGANAFPKTGSTLYVPYGSKEAYTESSVWGAFPKVKEGTFVEIVNLNGLTFECIVNDKNEKVTQLVKAASSLTDVVIPSEVQNGDATYRVTAIEDKAFEACTKLTVITSKISKENLFEFKKNVFPEAIYENATVYAPYDTDGSTEKKYRETEGWKYFEKYAKGEKKTAAVGDLTYEYIVGVGTATITKAASNISKVSIDGTVTIDGAAYTVKAIGANAFKGCNGLKVVWLPATLESIDKTAFSGCNNIAYVSSAIDNPTAADANIFPSSATLFVPQGRKSNYIIGGWNNFAYVGEGRFVDTATASDMTFDCYTDNAGQKKAILKKYNANAATVEIPGSVKVGNDAYTVSIITKQAFASKTYMESLIIPSGVETIEAEAFNACSKLKWIESKIVNPISISNVFANTNATLFIPSNNVSDYKARGWNFLNVFVGDRKTTDVDGWTYVYSTGDKKAVLTRVGNVGTNVTINGTFKIGKDEYTVTSVGDAVFKGKSNIEALTIAKSIENIGANAFEGCVKLVSITCEGSSPAKLGADAFPSANVTVNVPNDAIDTYKNHADWKLFGEHILGITTSVEDDPTGAYNIIVPAGGDATPEVEIWSGLDASGDVVIPEVVELNGSDYKVTGIAANAYDSNTDLTSIVIPSSITSIGASAFAGCTNLKSITVNRVTPIDLSTVAGVRGAMTRAGGSSSVFEGVNKETCILYVPAESIDAYKQAEGWKDFKKIYAISATAINGIVISEGKPFDVYNLQGRKVKANTTTFSGLPAGVYIVNGKKVMVK